MKYCKRCGQQIEDAAAFCSHCGYPQQSPTGAVPPQTPPAVYPDQKSRIAAGILGILVGALGIHNFYLGYTSRGLTQLLVTVCTCGIGAIPMEIWGLIEGIQLLCGSTNVDANGVPLKE